MNKFQRIQLVRALGLNTEESVLISNDKDWELHQGFLQSSSAFSVRTFKSEQLLGDEPHYPVILREELANKYFSLLNSGFNLIIAKCIDPANAQMAGGMLYEGSAFHVEVALGPGTVRRVTREGRIDLTVKAIPGKPCGNHLIDEAVKEGWRGLRTLQSKIPELDLEGLLYEFSVYGGPVGWKHEKVIFWELVGSPVQESVMEGTLPH